MSAFWAWSLGQTVARSLRVLSWKESFGMGRRSANTWAAWIFRHSVHEGSLAISHLGILMYLCTCSQRQVSKLVKGERQQDCYIFKSCTSKWKITKAFSGNYWFLLCHSLLDLKLNDCTCPAFSPLGSLNSLLTSSSFTFSPQRPLTLYWLSAS